MARLFDASSLVATILERDGDGLGLLFDNHVLDLTFYEAGNVFWKASVLQDRITASEASESMAFLQELEAEMVVAQVDSLDFDRTMEIASAAELTFYDAAYVAAAEELDATLITEDTELTSEASSYVDASGIGQLT